MTTLMEEWLEIEEYPGYWVSDQGRVRSRTGRPMTPHTNQRGLVYVSVFYHGRQHSLSIARLVAEAFLPTPSSEAFDTPINLDGDRTHNTRWNILWRPRWFAMKYHTQFKTAQGFYNTPVQDADTGYVYTSAWEAAVTHGLLARDVISGALNDERVWPTGHRFQLLDITHIIPAQNRGIV